mmetsp:Transcript_42720/g.100293  ORF Transcript_42720/g.100293 Transcript_42720/m.100293 type:complete len:168 (+) Transcript_42720:94-597(+)
MLLCLFFGFVGLAAGWSPLVPSLLRSPRVTVVPPPSSRSFALCSFNGLGYDVFSSDLKTKKRRRRPSGPDPEDGGYDEMFRTRRRFPGYRALKRTLSRIRRGGRRREPGTLIVLRHGEVRRVTRRRRSLLPFVPFGSVQFGSVADLRSPCSRCGISTRRSRGGTTWI